MIKAILIFNNFGKPRLLKFYEKLDTNTQQKILQETFILVSKKSSLCSFLEGSTSIRGSDTRVIYRQYATLYFVFVVDKSESELGILDLIQVFVETLNRCFENVCELDLVFNFTEVNYILSEIVLGGMVVETNINEIMRAVNASRKRLAQYPHGVRSPV